MLESSNPGTLIIYSYGIKEKKGIEKQKAKE